MKTTFEEWYGLGVYPFQLNPVYALQYSNRTPVFRGVF